MLTGEAASADAESAATYPAKLAKLIEEGGYKPQQVFNVDETGLFWKRLPSRTYISKEEASAPGHKAAKNRITLLLGGNASGDYKLKPLLVNQFENPRPLKGIAKSSLPVHWAANTRAWVTLVVFEDWFNNHFVPEVKNYLASKGLPFKVLLLLDNAPGHPTHLNDINENVKVEYLPPNTTSLLQPMDQGVIASFKAYYLRRTIAQAVRAVERDESLTLTAFWKNYNIKDCIKNVSDSWDEVKVTNMNGVWGKLCPQFVNDFHGFEESVKDVTKKIVALSNTLNLGMEEADVNEVLDSHGEELSPEDLIELENSIIESEANIPTPEPRRFSVKQLSEAFTKLEDVMSMFESMDPNVERYLKVSRSMNDAVRCYKEIWNEKKKVQFQTSLTTWFKASEPAPEPETTVAEEEILPDLLQSSSNDPEPSSSNPPEPSCTKPMPVVDVNQTRLDAFVKKKKVPEEVDVHPSSPAGSSPASPTSQ